MAGKAGVMIGITCPASLAFFLGFHTGIFLSQLSGVSWIFVRTTGSGHFHSESSLKKVYRMSATPLLGQNRHTLATRMLQLIPPRKPRELPYTHLLLAHILINFSVFWKVSLLCMTLDILVVIL